MPNIKSSKAHLVTNRHLSRFKECEQAFYQVKHRYIESHEEKCHVPEVLWQSLERSYLAAGKMPMKVVS